MERGTVASGRRSSQAPEPTCEWLMREVASRCGTVAPAFCESKESHASLATSHASLLTTADSECCERHEEDVPSASPNQGGEGRKLEAARCDRLYKSEKRVLHPNSLARHWARDWLEERERR